MDIKEIYAYPKQGVYGARTERIRYSVVRVDWQILLELLSYKGPNSISALLTLIKYWYGNAIRGPYLPLRTERSGIGDLIKANNSTMPWARYNIC